MRGMTLKRPLTVTYEIEMELIERHIPVPPQVTMEVVEVDIQKDAPTPIKRPRLRSYKKKDKGLVELSGQFLGSK